MCDDVIVCKPDKGQGVVILNIIDYINKIKEILKYSSNFVDINNKDASLNLKDENKLNTFIRKKILMIIFMVD